MSAIDTLKKRAGTLAMGALSFGFVMGAMRWSQGEPLIQPTADVGVLIGVALVATFFVVTDAGDAPVPARKKSRASRSK